MTNQPDMHHEALELAAQGFKVIPIGPGQKHPPLPAWQKAATSDPATITAWWTGLYRNHGIGIATGHAGLFVIDIDAHGEIDGHETWAALCEQHPELYDLDTIIVITGSDGTHIYLRAPEGVEIRNDAGRRLGPGIDIRGIGGQVLAPPTVHPNGTRYAYAASSSTVADAPACIIERLTRTDPAVERAPRAPSAPVTPTTHPTVTGDETPMDWFNRNHTWEQLLTAAGWHHDHTDRTGEQHWTRPGKNGGTSATIGWQGNDALHVFTSSIPELTPDQSISKFRFHSLTNHNGDDRAAATAIRTRMQPATPFTRPVDLTVTPTTSSTEPAEPHRAALLPETFWTARPNLQHIRQAAHSRMLAPDGLLGAVLARLASLTHHNWKLPATIGSEAGLDFYAALVGQPGAGKGRSMSVAAQLLPNPSEHTWLAGRYFEGPIGSGEGMVRAFYRRTTDPDDKGKPVSRLEQDCWNALFRIDEGEALDKLARRSDQTTMTTLRQMFSSEELGATYSNEDKNLRVRHYRCGLVMGIQPSRARFLLDDANGGTPARFTWWNLHDPTVPLDGPDWPGPLNWNPPHRKPGAPSHYSADGHAIDLLTIHPAITLEVRQIRHAFLTNGSDDPLHGHLTLVKLKTAAEVLEYSGAFLQLYREEGWYLERTCHYVSRVGLDHVKKRILDDASGRRALWERLQFSLDGEPDPWFEFDKARVDTRQFNPVGAL